MTIRLAIWPNAYRVAPASGSVWGPSKNIEGHFSDFHSPHLGAQSRILRSRSVTSGFRESRQYWKNADRPNRIDVAFRRIRMHARPEFREILIAQRIRHWHSITRCRLIAPKIPPSRARKNYWRLCKSYPEVMAKLGLTEASVYDPL